MTVYEKTMAIKLIIFDFDGTLGDTRRHIVTTMQAAIQELGLPERTEEAYIATIGLPLAGCFETLYPDESQEMRDRYVETYRRIFAENLKRFKPQAFPQVKDTMAALREKGLTLTIASSRSHASLVELTKDMQIAESVSYLIGADDVKNAKPHPEPVLNTLAATHFEADETLVVGDMPVDIMMGAHAGARTCGVTWGNGSRQELEAAGADYVIDRMEDVWEVVSA